MLAHKTAAASLLVVATRMLTRFGDLITLLVLAYELKPADFGLVALASSLIFITESIFELPLVEVVLRVDVLERSHLDTAFTLSALRGLGVMTILLALAWPFAHFYHDPRLMKLIAVLSLSPVTRGLQSPKLISYIKEMSFWRSSVIELVGKVMALIIAVTIAILTKSYWAIAAGTVAAPVTMAIASFVLAPYRPLLCLTQWRYFAGFLGWTSLAQIIRSITWQSDTMLLGRIAGHLELGLFTTANNLSSIPLLAVLQPIYRPLLASLSSVKHDPERLRRAYQLISIAAITIGLPALIGESLLAKPLIQVLLGPHWLAAVPMMRYLALSIIPCLFALPLGPMVMALNQAHYFPRRNAFELCVKLPILIVAGIKFGVPGIIAARVISEIAVAIYAFILARRLIGLGVFQQIIGPWRSYVSAALMTAGVMFLGAQLQADFAHIRPIFLLASLASAGAVIYVASLTLLWLGCGRPPGIEHVAYQNIAKLARLPLAKPVSRGRDMA
ncbi:MAG TPA: oligosaccharide flippase family protein [Acidocella sp.]|jgi:O-antigen/teichoic acid export membrane protein|uniref:oligosaccharide flippase family protein n=1 Tax=Acidocella sp. TaxID=50710 RepID=UPI002D114492|nr:oligosaccharide flippase family protein [Acidocella sp.]HVE22367.1 oligosaccharide flippase family protein [Acidocella sp.]